MRPTARIAVCLILFCSSGGLAQQETPIRGFSAEQAREHRRWEQKLAAIPQPNLLREYMEHLAAEPHHLGSPRDHANAEWILAKFRSFGLDASIEQFRVLFPTPKERVLELVAPEKYTARLKEPAIASDPDSSDANQLPTYNAYSRDGDVEAQLVYVNYGVPSDYETLKKLGVDVAGKIVLARYGSSWRGIKPKVAAEHGAVGCIIYSDPKDDGYYQGDAFPEGAFRPEHGVQRGSVMDMPIHPGDPLTPGIAAAEDARRLALRDAATITRIPVLPISYADALPLLRNLRGPVAPEPWRGALATTYHVGAGPAVVHLKVTSSWDLVPLYNVIARIPGDTFPDEWIIQGNHHDAWVNGASDPVSGLVALLEEARALGDLRRQGWRPKRTIVLAAWDGEEQGLIGSTEWVEAHAAELRDKAVVYINGDSNGRGFLSAGGSHALERFVHEVARDVPDPSTGRSVYDALRARRLERAKEDKEKKEIADRKDLRIGALGSGSDYTAFVDFAGVASLNLGFSEGENSGGVYHSIYDSFAWYTRFSDTTFAYGRTLTVLDGIAVLRLADAFVLPFEFTNLAETFAGYVRELQELASKEGGVDLAALAASARQLETRAREFEDRCTKAMAAGALSRRRPEELRALNKLLYQSERLLISADGLPGRPWFKHQLYAPGLYTGYGVKTVPYVREGLEQKRWDEARKGVDVVRQRIDALGAQIDAAKRMLE